MTKLAESVGIDQTRRHECADKWKSYMTQISDSKSLVAGVMKWCVGKFKIPAAVMEMGNRTLGTNKTTIVSTL